MSAVEWSDAEREAARQAVVLGDAPAGAVLDVLRALAPFVAAREEQAHAEGERAAIAERDALRATVARVEELADSWEDRSQVWPTQVHGKILRNTLLSPSVRQ